ncbi:MAG: precorrin-6y C5,15-methyltransferase (decarboxylating) subunit CbiE [Geminicoccaceae bacterium]|nr:precorrin-6y C5,15-methyltransferase (decarboxylating) subunit CbiE [Geminicoccaceae bacterium]
MRAPWLNVVGIGEDGFAALAPVARTVVETAEHLIGGERHLAMVPVFGAERIVWPSPLGCVRPRLGTLEGRRVVVLATGDPMDHGIGVLLHRWFEPSAIAVHPAPSAFALACARMGWARTRVTTLSLHGRPAELLIPHIAPCARLLVLADGAGTPAVVAQILAERGCGASKLTVLAHIGGPREQRFVWHGAADVPDFHTLAVEIEAGPGFVLHPRMPGLPDAAFVHDGNITKREVRALTLAGLAPVPGGLLWDVGCGCGSIAVEWLRAADRTRAVGIEPRADRRAMAAANASALGTPDLALIDGRAPEALDGLDPPDAVFIGGGLSHAVVDRCMAVLRPFGRIVANAVTLGSEAVLLEAHARHGGELVRLAVARAEAVGDLTGWRPAMPVTQWRWTR